MSRLMLKLKLTVATVWIIASSYTPTTVSSRISMLSVDQIHVVSDGASVRLDCTFIAEEYSLFDYPVLWRKTQQDEDIQVNVMGNINEPFLSSNRFEVTFAAESAPRYDLLLTIEDVVVEDSGNYTCELRGPQSFVLHHITHSLYVRYSPKVECPVLTEASVGDRDVSLDCEISAKPPITEVLWILDANGTVLKEGEQNTNYMAVYTHRRDKVGRVQLYIRQVAFDSFRRFTIVAENRIGIATKEVELTLYHRTTQPTTPTKTNLVYRDVTRDLVRRNYFYMRSVTSSFRPNSVPFVAVFCLGLPLFTLDFEYIIFRDAI